MGMETSHLSLVHRNAMLALSRVFRRFTPTVSETQCTGQCERSVGSPLTPVDTTTGLKYSLTGRIPVIDPRSNYVKRWNRLVLMARGAALVVDPLFLYVIALSRSGPCFYMDVALAFYVTVFRACLDSLHLAFSSSSPTSSESMVIGCLAVREVNQRVLARRLDQIVIWLFVPNLLRGERPTQITATVLLTFLFQFIPIIYHTIHLAKRLKQVTGYIFSYGNIWWRFKLNVVAYLTACHIVVGMWEIFSNGNFPENDKFPKMKAWCLDEDTDFGYRIYQPILPLYKGNTRAIRIIYWGLNNLGSFANNLTPTSDRLELIFSCCLCLAGMSLFITLLGNIQIFLHLIMANKKKMQLKYRDMEWWMHRRQLC